MKHLKLTENSGSPVYIHPELINLIIQKEGVTEIELAESRRILFVIESAERVVTMLEEETEEISVITQTLTEAQANELTDNIYNHLKQCKTIKKEVIQNTVYSYLALLMQAESDGVSN